MNDLLIVGIGASAGGIAALGGFFSRIPPDSGMAFVVVTHLSPDRKSLLADVVSRQSQLPVSVAEDGSKVLPNTVHIMPEGRIITISDGCLRLTALDPVNRERKPVDVFLSSLAEDQGENAAGIIMSGGDSDGTLGIKAIKQHGGITMAQVADGTAPGNPEMPNNAIASGFVDFPLPVEQMFDRLQDIRNGVASLHPVLAADEPGKSHQQPQQEISRLLRNHSGHDFSGYKSKTFFRRVARRMQVLHLEEVEAYIEHLRAQPSERALLFRDLLINVTGFFRDPLAFEALRTQVLPRLLEGRGADQTIRIWVPGCATGEEVYSIAILMREALASLHDVPRVQVFATDIDEAALSIARAGRYPYPFVASIDPEVVQRHFRQDSGGVIVCKEVREMCIFSMHSVTSDPPFSRMDLISCRNLLIYLGADLQDRVIPTFHYALKPGGYLFLGMAESASRFGELFTPVDKAKRIFQSREATSKLRTLSLDLSDRLPRGRPSERQAAETSRFNLRQRVETHVLESYAPAHVVVSQSGDIVYFSSHTARYLEMPRGTPTRQLMDTVRPDLRLDLRVALQKVMDSGRRVERRVLLLDKDPSQRDIIQLSVEPLARSGSEPPLFLVVFAPIQLAPAPEPNGSPSEEIERREANERDLREIRERLQSTVEEYETALEELKASNEELLSVNEEGQSTNEELEASKEEAQSLNEELSTINAELQQNVEQLDRANADLKNLFAATQVATIFLDGRLAIREYTPAASRIFNLRSSDLGRPLTDLVSALDYPELQDHVETVFRMRETIDHRTVSRDGQSHFLVRLAPYIDEKDAFHGVVSTFVDISVLAQAEAQQRILIEELNHRVKNMLAVVISVVTATHRRASTPEMFVEQLVGRLHGMSRAYALMSSAYWDHVEVRDLIEVEAQAHDGTRIEAVGQQVRLGPDHALPLGMVLHELFTNAVKYGALSAATGLVRISWELDGGVFAITWRESGGPVVSPPLESGFGLALISGQVKGQLGGSLETAFDASGLTVRINLPLR